MQFDWLEGAGIGVLILFYGFVVICAVFWTAMPFYVYYISRRVDRIHEELRQTNNLLRALRGDKVESEATRNPFGGQ